jgi:hypothetical protein
MVAKISLVILLSNTRMINYKEKNHCLQNIKENLSYKQILLTKIKIMKKLIYFITKPWKLMPEAEDASGAQDKIYI